MWSLRSQEFKTDVTLQKGKEMTVQINLKNVLLSYLVPWVLLTRVLPTSLTLKMDGAFTSYQSLRVNGSTIFFLAPFLPAFRP